jgi:hypothetical protein
MRPRGALHSLPPLISIAFFPASTCWGVGLFDEPPNHHASSGRLERRTRRTNQTMSGIIKTMTVSHYGMTIDL